jgi:predicted acylesterase/phospholipase RssA
MPLVLLWTKPWELVMDCFLEGARVEDLGIRFAAVAAALPETDPPSATVVVHGTLGEAVRVSGSLPPSFAPSDKDGIRYTDGGAGTAVPAQVARDCGADVVLACNVIPGPARGNPFSVMPPLGWLVRKTPFVGRMVDNYTWYAFFMQQTSRAFGDHADVYVEFAEQDFPFIESSAFIAAKCIIAKAEKEMGYLKKRVSELDTKWKAL